MNRCKQEQVGTKEFFKMLKRVQVLEDGRVPAKEARSWRIEGQKRRITREEYQRLLFKFLNGRFYGLKKDCGVSLEKRCCRIGESHLKEDGDVIGEYKGTHEEIFLSNWLREDGKEKERIMEIGVTEF